MMIRDQSRILISCNLAILGLILVTLFISIPQWQKDWKITHRPIQQTTIASLSNNIALVNELPEMHLFGQSPKAGNVPISSLDYHLTGIAKYSNKTSKAYISYASQPSKIFAVGDMIAQGIKLYDVLEDEIVVENNGQLEKLPLGRTKLEFKQRSQRS